jgi:cell division protein YceG involved in septum cleavage
MRLKKECQMNEAQKSQRSKSEKIVIVAVLIVVLVGISYMAYDYVTTMEQLDNLKTESNENLSLTENSNIDSIGNDDDT